MLARIFYSALQALENTVFPHFPRHFPALAVAAVEEQRHVERSGSWDGLKKAWEDAILWAVPKSRRTLERRHKRMYGSPEYRMKILQPKNNLRMCITCGHHHEVGVLCPNCYDRVKTETQKMQEEIQQELGLQPIDKDVVVLYQETPRTPGKPWQGKRIVELKRPRPAWFSKNPLEKTTQPPATTKEVKPTDLG
uniref:Large ribosomal subunit protein bL32m n=1 Tax=Lutzomyia longipalpis TaxID=7200 RepID=A0A1B0CDX7_LUTLO